MIAPHDRRGVALAWNDCFPKHIPFGPQNRNIFVGSDAGAVGSSKPRPVGAPSATRQEQPYGQHGGQCEQAFFHKLGISFCKRRRVVSLGTTATDSMAGSM